MVRDNRDKSPRRAESGGELRPTNAGWAERERQRGPGPSRKPLPELAIETKKPRRLASAFAVNPSLRLFAVTGSS